MPIDSKMIFIGGADVDYYALKFSSKNAVNPSFALNFGTLWHNVTRLPTLIFWGINGENHRLRGKTGNFECQAANLQTGIKPTPLIIRRDGNIAFTPPLFKVTPPKSGGVRFEYFQVNKNPAVFFKSSYTGVMS